MNERRAAGRSSDTTMRVLFFATFLVASLGLLVGWRESVLLPAAWAVLCMLVYAAVARWRFPDVVGTESFADSFYYLGFLLTLVALIGVLIHLGNLTGDGLLEGVLRHFGIALATTVVGLLGRVLIVMFGREPDAFAQLARTQVEQAYDSLTRSLNRMAAEAEAFGNAFGTRLNTALGPIEPAVQRMVSSADRAATGLQPLEGAVASFSGSLDDARVNINQAARGLEQDIGATRSRLDQSTARFEQQLTATTSAMTEVVASLSTLTGRIGALSDDSGGSLRSLRADAERLHGQVELVARGLGGLATAIEDQQGSVRANVARWEEAVRALIEVHGQLVEQVEASHGAAAAVRAEVAEGVRFLRMAMADPSDEPVEA